MAFLKNIGKTVISFEGKHIIPGGDAVEVSEAGTKHPVIQKKIKAKELEVVNDIPSDDGNDGVVTFPDKPLKQWNKTQLEAKAKELELDIADASNNEERVALIEAKLAEIK